VVREIARDRSEELRRRTAHFLPSLWTEHEQLAASVGGTDAAGDEAERLQTIDGARETALGERGQELEVGRSDALRIGFVDDRQQVVLRQSEARLALEVAV